MKKNLSKDLLRFLQSKGFGTYIPSSEIVSYFSISKRQVQKYIASINNTSLHEPIILSSRKGYALNPNQNQYIEKILTTTDIFNSPESRRLYILQKIISSPEIYDVFDFSEELFISESTVEADLQKARQYLQPYYLIIKKKKSKLYIEGKEKDKRRFMQEHLFHKGYENFSFKGITELLSFHYNLPELYETLRNIFFKHEIFVNDYALHNIVIHIIVTIERIHRHFDLNENIDLSTLENEHNFLAAQEIVSYVNQQYHVTITTSELYNLILLISNNTSLTNYAIVNAQNIEKHINPQFIHIARDLLNKVENAYHLEPFNEEFIATFTIHIENLLKRVKNDATIKNPLTKTFKYSYPLIYDIAVFIAQTLYKNYQITIDEDEIAFIAFHVGSFFEISDILNKKVSCLFTYSDYYGFYQNEIKKLKNIFDDDINIIAAFPISYINQDIPKVDLIISTNEIGYNFNTIVINPFLTDNDIEKLRKSIKKISLQKRNKILQTYLSQLFHEDIFYRGIQFNNATETIYYLTQDIIKKNYALKDFTNDVLAREKLSSTAFNEIAIPHSLTNSALESFIAFATCNEPISWGTKKVSLVILIGLAEESKYIFSEVFDSLIDILSNTDYVQKLSQANSYEELITFLIDAIKA